MENRDGKRGRRIRGNLKRLGNKNKGKQAKDKFWGKVRGDSLQELAGKFDLTNVPEQPGVTIYCPVGATDPHCPAGVTGPTDIAEALCYCKDKYRCPPCNKREVERYILMKKPPGLDRSPPGSGIKSVTQGMNNRARE